MSLRKLMNAKREPKEARPPMDTPEFIPSAPMGTPAEIPIERQNQLASVPVAQGAQPLSLNDLLAMDSEGKGVYDAIVLPIGGQNKDFYSILERTRMSQYEIELFTDAIDLAEHGLGYGSLDAPIPRLGQWIVSKMRGYVSKDGASLQVFENVAAGWIERLYKSQQQIQNQNKAVG